MLLISGQPAATSVALLQRVIMSQQTRARFSSGRVDLRVRPSIQPAEMFNLKSRNPRVTVAHACPQYSDTRMTHIKRVPGASG
jgi:hypothetical protein